MTDIVLTEQQLNEKLEIIADKMERELDMAENKIHFLENSCGNAQRRIKYLEELLDENRVNYKRR